MALCFALGHPFRFLISPGFIVYRVQEWSGMCFRQFKHEHVQGAAHCDYRCRWLIKAILQYFVFYCLFSALWPPTPRPELVLELVRGEVPRIHRAWISVACFCIGQHLITCNHATISQFWHITPRQCSWEGPWANLPVSSGGLGSAKRGLLSQLVKAGTRN